MAHQCAGPVSSPFNGRARDPSLSLGALRSSQPVQLTAFGRYGPHRFCRVYSVLWQHMSPDVISLGAGSQHGWCWRSRTPLLCGTGRNDRVGNVPWRHSEGATYISVMNCLRHLKVAISSYTFVHWSVLWRG